MTPLNRVIIVEDQLNVREEIELLVQRQSQCIIAGSCGTVAEAKMLIAKANPDILLLDIQLPDGTAFDLLHQLTTELKVIFITAFERHAIKAIKYGALDYIVKPFDELELKQAILKAIIAKSAQVSIAHHYHQFGVPKRLVLRSKDYIDVIELPDLVYCESHSGYTYFMLKGGKKIMASKTLKEFEDILAEPYFIRPHQSYLVNTSYIEKYRKRDDMLILKDSTEIPISTRNKEGIIQKLSNL